MKRKKITVLKRAVLQFAALFIVVLLLLFSCGDGSVDHVNGNRGKGGGLNSSIFPPPIISDPGLTLPYVISRNFVNLPSGTTLYVNVEMINGEYLDKSSPNYTPGDGIYDTNYIGEYQISVYSAIDQPKAVFTAPVVFSRGKLNFDKQFQLMFDDYNDDGNPDFTLGQWGSTNGNVYQIYTVATDGGIKQLPCENLSAASFDYSIALSKTSPTSFTCEGFDDKTNEKVTRSYNWQDGRFVLELP